MKGELNSAKGIADRRCRASETIWGRSILPSSSNRKELTMLIHALGLGLVPIDPSDITTMNFEWAGGVHGCRIDFGDGRWVVTPREEAEKIQAALQPSQ